ncbi:hypothetical protein BSNK01_13070 [Bacillaceae bacterium]
MVYLVPEFKTPCGEILNIINGDQEPIGYIAYLYKPNEKLYVFGTLRSKGEEQNFIDIVKNFLDGLQHAAGTQENTQIFLDVGGEVLELQKAEKNAEEKKER